MKSQVGLVFLFFLAAVSAQQNPCEGQNVLFVNDFVSCARYFVCVNNVPHPMECPAGFHFEQELQACVSNDDPDDCDECPATGVHSFAVPESCVNYRLCINGVSMPRECSTGTMFDWRLGQCARQETVTCEYQRCPATGTVLAPDPQSCDHYLVCEEGVEIDRRRCADGLSFDPVLLSCSRSENVVCFARAGIRFSPYFGNVIEDIPTVPVVTSVPTAPTVGTRPPQSNPPIVPEKPPQNPPVNPTTTTPRPAPPAPPALPPGTVVQEWPTGPITCPPSGHFYFGHHISCAFFQVCSHGRLHFVNCPQGQRWSTVSGRCEFHDRSNCPHPR